MIVVGYQGIGKSVLSEVRDGFIDLDSSNFYVGDRRAHDWYIPYCNIAESLSKQGNVVFVSSHKVVRDTLLHSDETVVCIYPSLALRRPWANKLYNRWKRTNEYKDFRAFMNADDRYCEDIKELSECGLHTVEITSMDYSLLDLIENFKLVVDKQHSQ